MKFVPGNWEMHDLPTIDDPTATAWANTPPSDRGTMFSAPERQALSKSVVPPSAKRFSGAAMTDLFASASGDGAFCPDGNRLQPEADRGPC